MSRSWVSSPMHGVLALYGLDEEFRTPDALLGGHDDGLVESLRGALDVGGGDGEDAVAQLLKGAGALGEDKDAVAVVDDGPLLRDGVHAVDDGVDEEGVVEAESGYGLGVVVLREDVDGLPVGAAVDSC